MTTFASLVEEVLSVLRGYTRNQDQSTYLTSAWTSPATTFSVAKASRVNASIVEVGDELVEIDEVDRTLNTVTVPPYGRGAQGTTTVSSYPSGTKVTANPTWPRFRVKKAINDTIQAVGGSLFNIQKYTFTADATKVGFGIPATTSAIFDVRWRLPDGYNNWWPVDNWDINLSADTTDFPTGVSLDILEGLTHGCSVSVTVGQDPAEFVSDSDTMTTIGLPESCRDVLVYGAVWRLLSSVDAARLSNQSLTGLELADQSQPQLGGNLTQQIWRVFSIRLTAEIAEQQRRYPGKIHRVR